MIFFTVYGVAFEASGGLLVPAYLVAFLAIFFTAFTFVNISVIAHYYVRNRQRSLGQTFQYLIFPLIGAGFIGWLLTLLSKQTLVLGLVWLSIGFVYLFLRKKLFTKSSGERSAEEIA